jgi:hypothetical protein
MTAETAPTLPLPPTEREIEDHDLRSLWGCYRIDCPVCEARADQAAREGFDR